MKKKLFIITVLVLALILSMFTGCAGDTRPLRICIDIEYVAYNDVSDVDIALDEFLYTLKESGGLEDVEIEYIPANGPERENMLDRIRTELMTGGGPDVFIVNCAGSLTGDVGSSLFPMPEEGNGEWIVSSFR